MEKNTSSYAGLISCASLFLSVFAVIVSIKSCQISQNALHVTVLEYNNARSLILKGEVQNNNTDIKVSPLDSTFLLQEVHYEFPSEFGTGRKYAAAPNYLLVLSDEIKHFRKILALRYHDEIQEHDRIVGENARMPFMIEAYSSVKGQSFRSTGMYTLNFKFEIYADPLKEPSITLTGITFGGNVERGEDAKALLENEWKEVQK